MQFELSQLLCEGLETIRNVLIHDRARWGPLLSHGRQYESWWKAEFLTALEAWTWESKIAGKLGVWSEIKPRDVGLGESAESVDVVIGPANSDEQQFPSDRPRLWIELKERGTWWMGGPSKALGTANNGLEKDLQKWSRIPWTKFDAVVACHVTSHRAARGSPSLPSHWTDAFEKISQRHGSCLAPLSVGYPVPGSTDVLWCTIHFFKIHVPRYEGVVDLRERGIGEIQASSLRARLSSFREEWDRPDMKVYDDL